VSERPLPPFSRSAPANISKTRASPRSKFPRGGVLAPCASSYTRRVSAALWCFVRRSKAVTRCRCAGCTYALARRGTRLIDTASALLRPLFLGACLPPSPLCEGDREPRNGRSSLTPILSHSPLTPSLYPSFLRRYSQLRRSHANGARALYSLPDTAPVSFSCVTHPSNNPRLKNSFIPTPDQPPVLVSF